MLTFPSTESWKYSGPDFVSPLGSSYHKLEASDRMVNVESKTISFIHSRRL